MRPTARTSTASIYCLNKKILASRECLDTLTRRIIPPGKCNASTGRSEGVTLGRREVKPSVEDRILSLRKGGMGMLKIGRTVGVGTSVVQRVLAG